MRDLFGNEFSEEEARALMKRARKNREPKPNGYAALPGTGPEGETCKTCKHIYRRQYAKTYLKCGLMRAHWTNGKSSDIKAGSSACKHWEKSE